MKQHLAELLTYAVGNSYGAFYDPVFSALAEHGRLSFKALILKTEQSSELVAQTLASLSKQNLVLHFSDQVGNTSYEPNWETAYNLTLRAGTLVKLVEERHGELAARIFNEILDDGMSRVGDLVQRLVQLPEKRDSPHSQKSQANGEVQPVDVPLEKQQGSTEDEINSALHILLQSGLILPLNDRQQWPGYDLHKEADTYVKDARYPTGCNTKKDREACAEMVEELKRQWRDEDFAYTNSGHKRGRDEFESDARSGKRQRLNGASNGYGSPLDSNLELSVNYEKCNVALRTVSLTRWTARHVASIPSKVYQAAMMVLEGKIMRCYDPLAQKKHVDPKAPSGSIDTFDYDDLSPSFTAREVAAVLDLNIDLDEDLTSDTLTNGVNSVNGHSEPPAETNGDTTNHAARTIVKTPLTFGERAAKLEEYLSGLASDPREFVVRESGSSHWRIPFQGLTQKLIQAEVENVVTARFGKLAARVIRILNANGIIDLKQLAQLAIVKTDQVQMAITPLLCAGYVSAQELPRDNSRTVERSVWAYSYNATHARTQLLDDTFKGMARLLQRLEFEKSRRQSVLDKAARTDVAQNEEKYLTTSEQETLRRYRALEEFINRHIVRTDEVVALARDFSPMTPALQEFDQVQGHKHLSLAHP